MVDAVFAGAVFADAASAAVAVTFGGVGAESSADRPGVLGE